MAAAAELILLQDKEEMECDSSDEGIGGEEESEGEGEGNPIDRSLADSGYGGAGTPPVLSKDSRCVCLSVCHFSTHLTTIGRCA